MKIAYLRAMRRRRGRSRNGRAEAYSKRLRLTLRREMFRGIFPRVGLLLLFVAGTLLLFPPAKSTTDVTLRSGDIADRTIIAPFSFEVPLSPEEIQVRKADALLKVLPVYSRDRSIQTSLMQDLSELLDSLAVVTGQSDGDRSAALDEAQALVPYLPRRLRSTFKKSSSPMGSWTTPARCALAPTRRSPS
jgi:membrane-associated HD superfamily phosphohydrolase